MINLFKKVNCFFCEYKIYLKIFLLKLIFKYLKFAKFSENYFVQLIKLMISLANEK